MEINAAHESKMLCEQIYYCVYCCILDHLMILAGLQGKPRVKLIAVIQMGGVQGMNECEKVLTVQGRANWYTR